MGRAVRVYALHGGFVISRTDGDRHYVAGYILVRLYELAQNEYIIWREDYNYSRQWDDYIHLYPRSDGKYGRPSQ